MNSAGGEGARALGCCRGKWGWGQGRYWVRLGLCLPPAHQGLTSSGDSGGCDGGIGGGGWVWGSCLAVILVSQPPLWWPRLPWETAKRVIYAWWHQSSPVTPRECRKHAGDRQAECGTGHSQRGEPQVGEGVVDIADGGDEAGGQGAGR